MKWLSGQSCLDRESPWSFTKFLSVTMSSGKIILRTSSIVYRHEEYDDDAFRDVASPIANRYIYYPAAFRIGVPMPFVSGSLKSSQYMFHIDIYVAFIDSQENEADSIGQSVKLSYKNHKKVGTSH